MLFRSQHSFIGGGYANTTNDFGNNGSHNSIVGGSANAITWGTRWSTIGGGKNNTIDSTSDVNARLNQATIGGGYNNRIEAINGTYIDSPTISGGENNQISNALYGTIGGGYNNEIGPYCSSATIGGGRFNDITIADTAPTISGGEQNKIQGYSASATIGGGYYNKTTDANSSTIVGGAYNRANHNYSIVGGLTARSRNTGAFYFANGAFSGFPNPFGPDNTGDAQAENVVWRLYEPNASNGVHYQLYIDGTSEQLVIPENSVVCFTMNIQVVTLASEEVGAACICATVKRTGNEASISFVGTVDRHTMEDAGGFDCDVDLDTTTGAIYPFVQIPSNEGLKATAYARITYMKYDT